MADHIYTPLVKHVGFSPSPVAGNIPKFANSIINPNCVGTKLWEEWWDEQIDRCLNGYTTGGLFIPPRYYHFLNFTNLDGVGTGMIYPFFIDIHYELYELEYQIRKDPSVAGGLFPKKRRLGLSFWCAEMINYGSRFIDSYRFAVGSGLDIYADGLKSKVERTFNVTAPELMMHYTCNNDVFKAEYSYKTEYGWQDCVNSYGIIKTLKDNESKLEGEFFHDVILEETGENKMAEKTVQSVSHALRDGNSYIGKIWLPGTGSNMAYSGKVFASLYHNAKAHNLVTMFFPRYRFYVPAVRRPEKYKNDTPYLDQQYPDLKPEQLLGCEDVQRAKELIDKEIAIRSKHPDKRKLREFLQDMPGCIEDVFISVGKNDFDTEMLYNQNFIIDSEPTPRWRKYVLEYVKNKDGESVIPLQVSCRAATEKDKEWQIVKIYQMPDLKYKHLDVQGVDGYEMDKTETTDSIGGIIVVRRYNELKEDLAIEEPGIVPICVYNKRPPRKEMFWEISLKISIFYGLISNAMVSADASMLINHYKEMGCRKYLSPRPKSLESKDSKLVHDYGIKVTLYNKPLLISMGQSWVIDNVQYSWFKELNADIAAYNEEVQESDWDLADSLFYALARIVDMKKKPQKKEGEEEKKERYSFGYYDSKGNYREGDYKEETEKLFMSTEDIMNFKRKKETENFNS